MLIHDCIFFSHIWYGVVVQIAGEEYDKEREGKKRDSDSLALAAGAASILMVNVVCVRMAVSVKFCSRQNCGISESDVLLTAFSTEVRQEDRSVITWCES